MPGLTSRALKTGFSFIDSSDRLAKRLTGYVLVSQRCRMRAGIIIRSSLWHLSQKYLPVYSQYSVFEKKKPLFSSDSHAAHLKFWSAGLPRSCTVSSTRGRSRRPLPCRSRLSSTNAKSPNSVALPATPLEGLVEPFRFRDEPRGSEEGVSSSVDADRPPVPLSLKSHSSGSVC